MAACITPGLNRMWRVWLRGRVVCETNSEVTAVWARTQADKADDHARAQADATRWNRIHKARANAQRRFA
jgi:hypothetical protein